MTAPTVYYHNLILGDFKANAETLEIVHRDPGLIQPLGAVRAQSKPAGMGMSYEVSVPLVCEVNSSESEAQFWDRIRFFMISLVGTFSAGTDNSPAGPLCFVRDEDGTRMGTADKTFSTAPFSAGSGTMTVGSTTGWSSNQFGLLIDTVDSSIYETVAFGTVSAGNVDMTTVNSYSAGASLYRLTWYMPEVVMIGGLELPGSELASDQLIEFTMRFRGTTDPVRGLIS